MDGHRPVVYGRPNPPAPSVIVSTRPGGAAPPRRFRRVALAIPIVLCLALAAVSVSTALRVARVTALQEAAVRDAVDASQSAELGRVIDELELVTFGSVSLGAAAIALLLWGLWWSSRARSDSSRADALQAQLDFLVGASPAVLYTADVTPPHAIRFVSPNVARVFGHVGDVVTERLWLEPEKRAMALKVAEGAARNGRAVAEYPVLGPTGRRMWIRDECRLPEDGDRSVLVGCLTDVTDRHLAEAAVRRALSDTERAVAQAVRERDFLISAASHDLREPVRKIAAFTGLLTERLSADADAELTELLDILGASAARLHALIRDLLEYGASGSDAVHVPVDLEQVVGDVVDDLSLRIREADATIEVEAIPPVVGDPVQLGRVFANLISNSLTYTRAGVRPRVRVSGSRDGEQVVIRVEDNGVGFEPHYAENILLPFKRLHGQDAHSGTGIGLAICRKIVERHSGTIQPVGRPGEGATFILRLPVAPSAESGLDG